jgi:hypothetical protein
MALQLMNDPPGSDKRGVKGQLLPALPVRPALRGTVPWRVRGVLELITIRARIGFHGFPTDIVGGGFHGGMHGIKLTLLVLDFVLQLLDRAKLAVRLGTALWRVLPA